LARSFCWLTVVDWPPAAAGSAWFRNWLLKVNQNYSQTSMVHRKSDCVQRNIIENDRL
jgi:hypothetical protein